MSATIRGRYARKTTNWAGGPDRASRGGDHENETWMARSTGESLQGLRQVVTQCDLCLGVTLAIAWTRDWGPRLGAQESGWRLL